MNDDFNWLSSDDVIETPAVLANSLRHERKEVKRQFVNGLKKEALNILVPSLPPEDTDIYIVSNGSGAEVKHGINPLAFDFGTFIPHLVAMLAAPCVLYVSTWTMNRNHTHAMLEMFDNGDLTALTVITDPYFNRRESSIANELVTGLQQRKQRYLAFKNHVKCVALSTSDGRTATITGSANLSAQPRCEQYVLTCAPDVYRFFRDEFFEAMLTNAKR